MRRARLPEILALAVPLLSAGCGSDHHVSPWGSRDRPRLRDFVERPDLDAQIARVDAETAPLGLRLVTELHAELPRRGGPVLLRAYEGEDALGRRSHALRVATGHGVVMALGPLDANDLRRDQATELVPGLVPVSGSGSARLRQALPHIPVQGREAASGAFRSGTDLNGDGTLDVVVRSESGVLEIWRIMALGANRYEVAMQAPPTQAFDVDGDGLVDLVGEVALDPEDPIAPRLTDVATFDGGHYISTTPAARAFHAQLAAPRALAPPAPAASASPRPPEPPPPRDEVRLRGALERAWHAALSGKSREETLNELSREPVPPALRAAFERHRRRITALPEGRAAKEGREGEPD